MFKFLKRLFIKPDCFLAVPKETKVEIKNGILSIEGAYGYRHIYLFFDKKPVFDYSADYYPIYLNEIDGIITDGIYHFTCCSDNRNFFIDKFPCTIMFDNNSSYGFLHFITNLNINYISINCHSLCGTINNINYSQLKIVAELLYFKSINNSIISRYYYNNGHGTIEKSTIENFYYNPMSFEKFKSIIDNNDIKTVHFRIDDVFDI